MKKLFFILTVLLSTAVGSRADNVSFTISAPKQVIQGKTFQISFTLSNASGQDLRVPEFPGCSVLYGPAVSRGSQYSYVNGKATSQSEETYVYTLRADQEGTYQIGAATIKAGGKQWTTTPVTLKILPPDKPSSGDESGTEVSGGTATSSDQEVFARLLVSPSTQVYEQQAISVTVKLFSRPSISGVGSMNFPTFEEFAVQDIPISNPQVEMEHYNGKNYQTVVIKRYVIFPQRAGLLKITEGRYDIDVQVPRTVRNPFGIVNIPQEVTKMTTTSPVTVHVLPLPENKPASYMGAVGSFSMNSSITRESLKTNESVTIKLVIQGKGNIKYIKNPEIKFPEDFEVYDPKIDVDVKGLDGTRTIEYTAIPRHAGNFTVPSVEFSYFDTATKTYKTLTTPAYHLTVEKGTGGAASAISDFTDKESVRLLNQDIHFIKLDKPDLQKEQSSIYGGFLYWLWYILPALLFVLLVIFNYKQANADIALTKTRKANKVAAKRLKVAGKYVRNHDKTAFYDEILKAVWGYLSDKLNLPLSVLTRDNVAAELSRYGVGDDVSGQIISILDTCEFARYAPAQSDDAMDKLYADTIDVIGKMENTVKKGKEQTI
ncbi:MAG: protein BatD [Coprobacter sp.]|nr:protein BatD [Coprobacter sp.]